MKKVRKKINDATRPTSEETENREFITGSSDLTGGINLQAGLIFKMTIAGSNLITLIVHVNYC